MFAAPGRDTAQWSADSLGRSEIEEVAEGVSYGADPYRDGVTLTPKRELQSLALPSEITRLPNLTGYLKFPGPYPVARIGLQYVKRPSVSRRFVARNEPRRSARASEATGGTPASTDEKVPPVGNATGPGAPDGAQLGLPLEEDAPGDGAVDAQVDSTPATASPATGEPAGPEDEPGPAQRPGLPEDGSREAGEGEDKPRADAESGEAKGHRI